MASLVAKVMAEVAERMASAKKKKAKNRTDAEKAMKVAHKGTMKWLPFMSKFMPEKNCVLIKTGIRTNKGFKEVHLTILAKALLKNYGADVSSTQDHPKDAEILNTPIPNYDEMHAIFSFDFATGKYAMGSSETLDLPPVATSAEDADTHESDGVAGDGIPEKPVDVPEKVCAGKRKRGASIDNELVAFTNMAVIVRDASQRLSDVPCNDFDASLDKAGVTVQDRDWIDGKTPLNIGKACKWALDTASDLLLLTKPPLGAKTRQRPARWIPPPAGFLKINTDAAFDAINLVGASGCVVRNADGVFLRAASSWLESVPDALTAEAIACCEGVKLCLGGTDMKIILESDCMTLVELWKTRKKNRAAIWPILNHIEALSKEFISFDFRFVSRKANMAAHLTAKNMSSAMPECIWVSQVPAFLANCIQHDCANADE
ncbi:hypothetical protein QYE76_039936 [Lolium multiflorum]|uniref:RNase H type-1 domain-containing protein n=1 Tax=Lolium multiflorum TaxID=4521 RepID=A0AAD8TCI8_LOLMU|nr:hypothetical protein QYE76_039936 [Lolium multiflorum]